MSNKLPLFLALITITSLSFFGQANAVIKDPVKDSRADDQSLVKHNDISFSYVWARASLSPNPNSVIYMDITNDSDQVYTLVSASAMSITDNVEIHQSFVDEKGIMRMAPIDGGIIIPPHTTVSLQPNGMHLMLLNLKKNLNADDVFTLTLNFKENLTKILSVGVRKNY